MSFEAHIVCDGCGKRERVPTDLPWNIYYRQCLMVGLRNQKPHAIRGWTEIKRGKHKRDSRRNIHFCVECTKSGKATEAALVDTNAVAGFGPEDEVS